MCVGTATGAAGCGLPASAAAAVDGGTQEAVAATTAGTPTQGQGAVFGAPVPAVEAQLRPPPPGAVTPAERELDAVFRKRWGQPPGEITSADQVRAYLRREARDMDTNQLPTLRSAMAQYEQQQGRVHPAAETFLAVRQRTAEVINLDVQQLADRSLTPRQSADLATLGERARQLDDVYQFHEYVGAVLAGRPEPALVTTPPTVGDTGASAVRVLGKLLGVREAGLAETGARMRSRQQDGQAVPPESWQKLAEEQQADAQLAAVVSQLAGHVELISPQQASALVVAMNQVNATGDASIAIAAGRRVIAAIGMTGSI